MTKDKILNKTININSTTSKVWAALTTPDIIKQWLFGTNVISDWKADSQILFTGNWQGTVYKDKGTILLFEKEKIFQYNYWSSFSGLPDSAENYSIITFVLAPTSNGTNLTLTQSNFATETAYEHSDKNWAGTLDLMKKIIEQ
jgi:uncharacterized protein YndB with AHSA1/START domain